MTSRFNQFLVNDAEALKAQLLPPELRKRWHRNWDGSFVKIPECLTILDEGHGQEATIDPKYFEIGNNAIIDSGTVIRAGASIGSKTDIRSSYIDHNTIIKGEATLCRSITGPETYIQHNCKIYDTRFGQQVHVGQHIKVRPSFARDVETHVGSGATIGDFCVVEAGAILPEGTTIPPACHVEENEKGTHFKVRPLDTDEIFTTSVKLSPADQLALQSALLCRDDAFKNGTGIASASFIRKLIQIGGMGIEALAIPDVIELTEDENIHIRGEAAYSIPVYNRRANLLFARSR